jgi:hypothetical protein
MPYYKNEAAHSGPSSFGHEESILRVLKKKGFSQIEKSSYPSLQKLNKSHLAQWYSTKDDAVLKPLMCSMPNGSFIFQPLGTHSPPDFLMKDFSGRYVALECKSNKGSRPMWNDNTPKPNVIYILSSKKYDATTVFLGCDVICQETYDRMIEQEAEINRIIRKYETAIAQSDKFQRGWGQGSRRYIIQKGKAYKTDYFAHQDRANCEQRVLEFVNQR